MADPKVLARIDQASCVAFSTDGNSLAIGEAKTIRVLNTSTGEERFQFAEHGGAVSCLAPSADGRFFVSGDAPFAASRERPWLSIRVWDARTGEQVSTVENREGAVLGLDLDKGSHRIAAAFDSRCICAWQRAEVAERIGSFMVDGIPHGVRYIDNGAKIAYAHTYFDGITEGYYIKVFNPLDGKQLLTIRHTEPISCFAVSPCERRFAAGKMDGSVDVWDASTGEAMMTLEGPSHPVETIGWTSDVEEIVVVNRERDSGDAFWSARFFHADEGQPLRAFQSTAEQTVGMSLSRDGLRIAIISDYPRTVQLFDLRNLV